MFWVPIQIQVSYLYSGLGSEELYIGEFSGWQLGFTIDSGHLALRSRSGSCSGPVRVLFWSCSGNDQILVGSCSNSIEVLFFIPSEIYNTIRYCLFSSSVRGCLKPSLIGVKFIYMCYQKLSFSIEPHLIVLSYVTSLPRSTPWCTHEHMFLS
jgi:hypothetical protein